MTICMPANDPLSSLLSERYDKMELTGTCRLKVNSHGDGSS